MPIEQVEIGDEVWAADPESGEAGGRPVTALIEGEGVKDLVTVSTGSGSVVATAGHPFWSVSDAAWVDAGDLSVGDAVLQADGATSVITQVVEVSRPAVVHNLTVADLHTYFVVVGDAPTLVHNCSCVADADGISHAIDNHTAGGVGLKPSAGVWDEGVDLHPLAHLTDGLEGLPQTGSRNSIGFLVDAGRLIGTAGNGMPTSFFQVFRNRYTDELITMFPVAP